MCVCPRQRPPVIFSAVFASFGKQMDGPGRLGGVKDVVYLLIEKDFILLLSLSLVLALLQQTSGNHQPLNLAAKRV